ncbi:HPP family protein [Sulfurimonas lithotrophica]|nr:HPP family protein [Sulfurimonas lithotrophica]
MNRPNKLKNYMLKMKGFEKCPPRKPFSKILWSWLGAFLGIYTISILNEKIHLNATDTLFLVGSFGASAVLIFAAPQADFSQPRNFLGGHVISALVGITIYKFLHFDIEVLSAIAVSVAIIVMHFTRTIHPPGGATALVAIVGSEQTHQLGYLFAFMPILLNSFVMFVIALVINNLSNNPKRHYPRYWF